MNEVFITGKIVSNIEYKFIVNSKRNTAIAIFSIRINDVIKNNPQNIVVKCYNDLADFALRKIKKNDNVFINGKLNSNMEIQCNYISIQIKK